MDLLVIIGILIVLVALFIASVSVFICICLALRVGEVFRVLKKLYKKRMESDLSKSVIDQRKPEGEIINTFQESEQVKWLRREKTDEESRTESDSSADTDFYSS